MRLSIIIPTLNEAAMIRATAAALAPWQDRVEVLVVDGGSTDDTVATARACGLTVLSAPCGRGPQMNAGAQAANGDTLLFLHADTRLPTEALAQIEGALADPRVCGGNFSLRFEGGSWGARLLTCLYPFLRWGGMCYGDSAMFVRREGFTALGGYRDFPIFEDVDFYRRLKRAGRFVHLPGYALTSPRRFEGPFIRTFALWSLLQVLYWLGVPPCRLGRFYRPAR